MRSTKQRVYRKTKRADDERRTRARIVDAAEELHGTLGPSRTTISAIAERAAVTRATVYRHFADDEALFLACSAQWLARQQLPTPAAWLAVADPRERLRAGLADIYRYYRGGADMLASVLRDTEWVPAPIRDARLGAERAWREALLRDLPGRRRRTVQAAVGHATAFGTWRSLCADQELTDAGAVDLMAAMVLAATGGG
jgi:AcrR family transcriptional regulator